MTARPASTDRRSWTIVPDRAPARLVIRLPNWLGDAVMALPAMAAVRRAHPDVHIAVAGLPSITPIFAEMSAVHPQQVVSLEKPGEAAALRDGRFDTALLLTNSFRTAWTARQAGIGERWGYASSGRRLLLTRAAARPRGERHQSEYYLELVRRLGIEAAATAPRLDVIERTRARAVALLQQQGIVPGAPLVGFAPGAAYGHAKRWPPDRVAVVIQRLWRERQVRSVLVGAAGDREAGREIESTLPPEMAVVNLIGRTDLRVLMGIMQACRAFVSNDSGAMHLAAAVGIPVTALFGPTKERVTAPVGDHDVLLHQVFCRPCMLRECPIDHRCMKRISVDEVFASVTRRLDTHA
jgi:heptosyltransferase-2